MSEDYDLDQILATITFERLIGPIDAASQSLVRSDERIKRCPEIAKGSHTRSHFLDVAASAWLDGDLVRLEDLILHDVMMDTKVPSQALTKATALLYIRRRMASRSSKKMLDEETVQTFAQKANLDRDSVAYASAQALIYGEREYEDRLAKWLNVLDRGQSLPPVFVAALALDSWLILDPLHGRSDLGRLLVAGVLRQFITFHHLPAVSVGLREHQKHWYRSDPAETRLTALLKGLELTGTAAMEQLNRLDLARQRLLLKCEDRRRHSRLPDLIELFLSHPVVSIPLAKTKLGVSATAIKNMLTQLGDALPPERTGRTRYRAWGVM